LFYKDMRVPEFFRELISFFDGMAGIEGGIIFGNVIFDKNYANLGNIKKRILVHVLKKIQVTIYKNKVETSYSFLCFSTFYLETTALWRRKISPAKIITAP